MLCTGPNCKSPGYLFSDCKKPKKCHICARYRGVLTTQIENYMAKRLEYKRLSKNQSLSVSEHREFEIISNSYKILSNSAYGQMGHEFSKYENVLEGELITRFGRWTIQECAKIAKEILGWNVIYGDTDSLFIDSEIIPEDAQVFIDTCKRRLNVEMDLDKTYSKLLITGAKNYLGVLKDSKDELLRG